MSDVIIRAENLGKKYRIRHQHERQRYVALRDVVADKLMTPWRWLKGRSVYGNGNGAAPSASGALPKAEDFWALKDVSFEVKQGEVVGIIGRNGAGKSTLLKILSRITEPTTGSARIKGRVASLLEVGTGFHPELTGRENIYLNGAILGMTKAEIKAKFDEIVAFAEVEKFLDTPVKRYSSGMYVRLAFAVAAHLEPEILIVDEVLAVGDAEFQKKCLGRMEHVAGKEGRTVLFVSHNMASVESLCRSAIFLSEGRLVDKGDTKQIIKAYLSNLTSDAIISLGDRQDRQGSGIVRFAKISLMGTDGEPLKAFQCGADATFALTFENFSDCELRNLSVSLGIDNDAEQRVMLLDSSLSGYDLEKVGLGKGQVKVLVPKLPLAPGRYHFTIYSTINGVIADWVKRAGFFDVEQGNFYGTGRLPSHDQGMFLTPHTFTYQMVENDFSFAADLSGRDSLTVQETQ